MEDSLKYLEGIFKSEGHKYVLRHNGVPLINILTYKCHPKMTYSNMFSPRAR